MAGDAMAGDAGGERRALSEPVRRTFEDCGKAPAGDRHLASS
jgi:hypothetical protein